MLYETRPLLSMCRASTPSLRCQRNLGRTAGGRRRAGGPWSGLMIRSMARWSSHPGPRRVPERLCERPAPGAVEAVEWCDDMEAMCGRHYAIEAVYSNSCGYELTKSDTDDTFAVPFDACMFVSRDTPPRSSGAGRRRIDGIAHLDILFVVVVDSGNDGVLRLAPLHGDALAGNVGERRREAEEHRRQEPSLAPSKRFPSC